MGAPDLRRAQASYDRLAARYDRATHRIDEVRAAAVSCLALRPGEVVADIGCGTGFCLQLLARAVAPGGMVIGIEPCEAMFEKARANEAGNVTLIHAPAERARLPAAPDALLFSFVHDVLQSGAALDNLFAQVRPGARVVAVGAKLFPWWLGPANFWFLARERGYVTAYRGFAQPWRLLAERVHGFAVLPLFPGNKFLALGRVARVTANTRAGTG
jgi:demethylmenaquinone methyltransferase/2-methoxy-6-polyprenyl-1,4-benzoquinol methylase